MIKYYTMYGVEITVKIRLSFFKECRQNLIIKND